MAFLKQSDGTPFWVASFGLILSLTAASWMRGDVRVRDRERFQQLGEQFRQELETRVEKYESALIQLAEWIGWREEVSQDSWRNRIERMKLSVNYPAFVQLSHFRLANQPSSPMEANLQLRHQVHLTSPADDSLWGLAGHDFSIPAAANPVEARVGQDGLVRIWGGMGVRSTRGLRLQIEEQVASGFNLFTSVLDADVPTAAREADSDFAVWHSHRAWSRSEFMKGVVIGTIHLEHLLASIFGERELDLDFEIYAGEVEEPNRLTNLGRAVLEPPGLHETMELRWYSDRWNLLLSANSRFYKSSLHARPWIVGGSGVVLSLVLSGYIWVISRRRQEAEAWSQELESARTELQFVTRQREEFSRNLHDGVLQSLYAVLLGLGRARHMVNIDARKTAELIHSSCGGLEDAMRTIRQYLSYGRPEELRALELPGRLRGYILASRQMGAFQLNLDGEESDLRKLSDHQATQVFFAVKEAVSNAQRHGKAERITLAVSETEEEVTLSIEDNGCGFDPGRSTASGRGLQSMRERMNDCRGRFEVESCPGGPTTVRLTLAVLKQR
jgi:signal transduction histidine kinase